MPLYLLCAAVQVMSLRVRPDKGSVNYDPAMVDRSPLDRTMGIFNAITTVLFAYGELVVCSHLKVIRSECWSA
jgi:hypothetical protein